MVGIKAYFFVCHEGDFRSHFKDFSVPEKNPRKLSVNIWIAYLYFSEITSQLCIPKTDTIKNKYVIENICTHVLKIHSQNSTRTWKNKLHILQWKVFIRKKTIKPLPPHEGFHIFKLTNNINKEKCMPVNICLCLCLRWLHLL